MSADDIAELKAAIEAIDARLKAIEDSWRRLCEGVRQMNEEDRGRRAKAKNGPQQAPQ
jgi:hypothetical protein